MKQQSIQHQATLVTGIFSVVMFFALSTSYSFAETTDTIPLEDEFLLEKTTTTLNVLKDNTLPWATVKGTIDDPAQGYPVIIQFFDESNLDEPIHVAQVDVKGDDTYEYKFRVRNVDLDTGIATNIFEGNYTVKIFKVVNSQNSLNTI